MKLKNFLSVFLMTVITFNVFSMVKPVESVASGRVLEDTLGNRIYASSSKFIFDTNYSVLEIEKPLEINVKIDGATWLSLTTFEDSMSYMGFVASTAKGCNAADLPDYESFNINVGGNSVTTFGYSASRVKYEGVYSDGTKLTVNATQPISFSNDYDYLHTEADVKSYCNIVDEVIVGNDRDEHGCIPSAGTKWCASLKKCYRDSEESCPATSGTTVPSKAPVAEVTIPSVFKQEGSLTTDLSSLTTETAKSVSDFVLDNKGVGKIEYLETLDLSSEETGTKFAELDKYVIITEGKVTVDSKNLPILNRKARITMLGLHFLNGTYPTTLRDGEVINSRGYASNMSYMDGILTFDVVGFSTYEVRPTVTIDTYPEKVTTSAVTLTGMVDDLESTLTVNGEPLTYDLTTGKFETTINLEYGVNDITIVATGKTGAKHEQKIQIIRSMTYKDTQEVWTEQTVMIVIVSSLLGLVLIGLAVFVIGKKVVKKIRIKKPNTRDLSDSKENELEKDLKEEVKQEINDVMV